MGPETQAFLQNCWYVAAWDHELIDGKLLARTILEKPVVLNTPMQAPAEPTPTSPHPPASQEKPHSPFDSILKSVFPKH